MPAQTFSHNAVREPPRVHIRRRRLCGLSSHRRSEQSVAPITSLSRDRDCMPHSVPIHSPLIRPQRLLTGGSLRGLISTEQAQVEPVHPCLAIRRNPPHATQNEPRAACVRCIHNCLSGSLSYWSDHESVSDKPRAIKGPNCAPLPDQAIRRLCCFACCVCGARMSPSPVLRYTRTC